MSERRRRDDDASPICRKDENEDPKDALIHAMSAEIAALQERLVIQTAAFDAAEARLRAELTSEAAPTDGPAAKAIRLQARAIEASMNGIAICQVRPRGRLALLHANSAFARLTGFAVEELVGKDPFALWPTFNSSDAVGRIRAAVRKLAPHRDTLEHPRRDGGHLWADLSICPVAGDGVALDCVVAVITDVSEMVEHSGQMAAVLAREQAAMSFARVGSFSWDTATDLVQHSALSLHLLGMRDLSSEQPFAALRERIHPDSLGAFDDATRMSVGGSRSLDVEVRIEAGDGTTRWLHIRGDAEPDATQATRRIVALCQDVTERRTGEEAMRHIAHHDTLTGLPNRALMRDRLQQAVAAAKRNKRKVGVIFVDLDQFKNINDTLGHAMGDRLLQSVARRLRRCVRASDTVSRTGGDEYVLVLPDLTESLEAGRVAKKVLGVLSESHSIGGHELTATPSIGIAVYPDDGQNLESLLKNADSAMYHAKGLGRANFQFFTSNLTAKSFEHLALSADLRRAVRDGQLRMHYQPQFAVDGGQLVGAEAFLRWAHPERGLLRPEFFLAIAEESELILEVGDWAIREVCRTARGWLDAGLFLVPIAINVSPTQFLRGRLPETVEACLRETNLPPQLLDLALTGRMMSHPEGAESLIAALKALGVRLSLDDFGVGSSNLGFLKRLPFDRIKIDMSLIRGVTSSRADLAIVKAIIDMGRSLRLRTLGEGVESLAELDALRSLGCDAFQGYLGSGVLDERDFRACLESAPLLAEMPA